jgi:FkbM family methyltransferase
MMNGLQNISSFFARHPLTRDRPWKAWARFAAWQVRSRLQDEVIVSWVAGQKLAVRRGMAGATGNIYVGLHEFHDMMVPLHFLRPGDLFFDIGANIGSYTVLAAGAVGANAWSFEPDPGTARHLRRNIALNGLEGRVTVHELALGPEAGEVRFSTGLDATNKVVAGDGANTRSVRQEALDAVAAAVRPIMMKIDVEGYEDAVLAGASRVLADPGLQLVEIETVTDATAATLAAHGFRPAFYDAMTRSLADASFGHETFNALYVRDRAFVARRLAEAKPVDVLGTLI